MRNWMEYIVPTMLATGLVPCLAADRLPVEGVWRVVSFEREYQATGEREYPMGMNPTGFIHFLSGGRMAVVITAQGRKIANNEQERAALYDSLVAYTGTYRVDGDKWITRVDVSANPAWVGSEQARAFLVTGNRLQEMTAWLTRPDNRIARAIITYERVPSGPDNVKALLLRSAGWIANWSLQADKGQSEIIFEARGEKVVAKVRNLTFPTTCEHEVIIASNVVKFDGCYDSDITLNYDPDDLSHPFKGKSAKGYDYLVQPR